MSFNLTESANMSSSAKIDVHMLTMNEPQAWREACLKSLEGAPIKLHVLPGIVNQTGLARVKGFSQGSLPYVSYVDPDDLYNPTVYDQLLDVLESSPDVVFAYTDEAIVDRRGKFLMKRQTPYDPQLHQSRADHVHGVIVMRRSAVESVMDQISNVTLHSDWILTLLLAKQGRCVRVPVIGRYWRQHNDQSHLQRDKSAFELAKALKGVNCG